MKTIRLLTGFMLVFFMAFAPMNAKAHKGHKGRHYVYTPYWVPAHIVRANVRHIYFPNYNVYFDRLDGTFIFLEGRRWVVSTRMPVCFRGINFSRAYKVGLDIKSHRPYIYNRYHVADYRYKSHHYNQGYYKRRNGQYYHKDHNGYHKHGKNDDRYYKSRREENDQIGRNNSRRGNNSGQANSRNGRRN